MTNAVHISSLLLRIVLSYITPIIEYGAVVWSQKDLGKGLRFATRVALRTSFRPHLPNYLSFEQRFSSYEYLSRRALDNIWHNRHEAFESRYGLNPPRYHNSLHIRTFSTYLLLFHQKPHLDGNHKWVSSIFWSYGYGYGFNTNHQKETELPLHRWKTGWLLN